MSSLAVFLPILAPLLAAAISIAAFSSSRLQQICALAGTAGQLAAGIALLTAVSRGGIQVAQASGWVAPFGITLVADHLSAMMVVVTGIIGLSAAVYSLVTLDASRASYGYYPVFCILVSGVAGAFLAGDVFNLYVWFEVMLIASFVLLTLGSERPQIEGGVVYVILNLLSSALFLSAIGIVYGLTGSLNMADLAVRLPTVNPPSLVTAASLLFLVSFGLKAALFPLFFWLPASYHAPPAAVSAVFAGLLTKVGVYALFRFFTLIFRETGELARELLLPLSLLTMASGVLSAAVQSEFRRILSFHIISQIGYMTLGLALYSVAGLRAAIFYVIHHIIVKTNLFFVSGAVARLQGSYDLGRLGGLYRSRPVLAALFLVPAFSLAGMPPLSGFWGKLLLVQTSIEQHEPIAVAVALAVGLLTLFSMSKIWNEAFLKAPPENAPPLDPAAPYAGLLAPIMALAVFTIGIGLGAQPVLELSERAARELLAPADYIRAVLGENPAKGGTE